MPLKFIPLHRFWKLVDMSGDCWIFTGVRDRQGYGRYRKGKAHRFAWSLGNGPIPPGKLIRHQCDNPGCVRPDHLLLGTQADNVLDREMRGRNGSAKISADDVRCIRALYQADGLTQQEIADLYSISLSAVCLIVHRKRWAWVD